MGSDVSVRRGDVVITVFSGGCGKPRPAVVVQSDAFNPTHASVVLCPISTEQTGLTLFRLAVSASNANGLRHDSEVMIDKVGAVDRSKIRQRVGRLSDDQMRAVDRLLSAWFDLSAEPAAT
jgi:mRNA interferase MazF